MVLIVSSESIVNSVALVGAGGVFCLWLASRQRIPAILLLLPAGIMLGPVFHLVDPDEQFGDVLFPLVSIGVGLLLFEGGLSLRFDRIGSVKYVTARLVTIGAFVTWIIGIGAASVLFDLGRGLTVLLAALLVVSGPTVVQPLLRMAKPRQSISEVLRWEGIVIDPIGATLAVAVLDTVLGDLGFLDSSLRILTTLGSGGAVGLAIGVVLSILLGRHIVPDYLQNVVALVSALGAFAIANAISTEAGLMATTVLGLVLANQKKAPTRHIREFQEELSLLVLSALFLLLGARVDLDELVEVLPATLVLVAILIFVGRPLAVAVSTLGSGMTNRERAYVAAIAPRGIVAAAVSAVFALELSEAGIDPGPLVSITFSVIMLTVLFYGLTAVPVARLLRVARPAANGVAIVGADPWHLKLATLLQDGGIPVLVFTDRPFERRRAQQMALLTYEGELNSEELIEAAEAIGIKSLLVLSDRSELTTAVVATLGFHVGRPNLFALIEGGAKVGAAEAYSARPAFGPEVGTDELMDLARGLDQILVVEGRELGENDVPMVGMTDGEALLDGSLGEANIVCRPGSD